jgi:hypothetical protein
VAETPGISLVGARLYRVPSRGTPDARVVFISPQEAGFRYGPTHVDLFDFAALAGLAEGLNLKVERHCSFPFSRFVGRLFKYNEFVLLARKSI